MSIKTIARIVRTFKLDAGNIRARGAPAVILSIAGVILAAGIARSLRELVPSLPETIRESRALLESLRQPRGTLPLQS
jgi:hypothetical protein